MHAVGEDTVRRGSASAKKATRDPTARQVGRWGSVRHVARVVQQTIITGRGKERWGKGEL